MRFVTFLGLALLLQLSVTNAQDIKSIEDLKTAIVTARDTGKLEQTELLTEELATLVSQNPTPFLSAVLQLVRAQNDISRNRYGDAIEKLQTAIPTFESHDLKGELAEALAFLGYSHYNLSEYKQALNYYYQARDVYEYELDSKGMSMVNSYIGLALSAIGDYEGAISSYKTALESAIAGGYKMETSQALYSLGGLNTKLGNHQQALEYFSSSLEIDEGLGVVINIAFNHGLIAEALYHLKRFERAEHHATKAIELFEQIQSLEYAAMYKLTLAKVYLSSGDYNIAQKVVDEVYGMAKNDFPALTLNTLLVAAKVALESGDYERAVGLADKGIQQAQDAERMPLEEQFLRLKVTALETSRSFEQGYHTLRSLMEINRKINDKSKLQAISVAQAQTDALRSKLELELQTKERALQEAELNRQLILRNAIIVLIVFSSILVFFLFRKKLLRKTNQYLSEQVRLQTRELKEKNEQLIHALKMVESDSITDTLTGLNNRRYLEKFIDTDIALVDREYRDWRQKQGPKPLRSDLIIFVLDIDDFKSVNDTYGHNVGDEILVEFANRVADVFRQSDYIVRWGGEELVAVARFVDRKRASKLAKRILEVLNEAKFEVHDGSLITVTASVGYACYPSMTNEEKSGDWGTLFSMADACLYLAKDAGKNTWVGLDSVEDVRCIGEEFNKNTILRFIKEKRITINSPGNIVG